jgi:metal-responsive CopG/Arc/MetJ family transcriptional regulator
MSVVSIRLPENLLHEIDNWAHVLHIPRTQYIRKALEQMNQEVSLRERGQRLKEASIRVRKESMKINKEFGQIEDDPEN